MFVELALAGVVAYGVNKYQTRNISEVKRHWYKIMNSTNSYANDRTYEIQYINEKSFGYSLVVKINDGLSYEKLERLRETIQDNFGSLVIISRKKISNYATVEIITNPKNDLTFKPVLTDPYELFLGYDFKGQPIILNQANFPHLLIAGVTGTGKSRIVSAIVTNLLYNHDENEINLYMTQIKKADLRHFANCPQTKMFARTLEETAMMFEKINKLIDYRTNKLEESDVENIGEYNQLSNKKYMKYMKYIYLLADEFSFYMPDASDEEEVKELKEKSLKHLKDIILTGRSVGVFVICSLQRTTVDNIPSTIKSQMTRLTFRQISKINSNNVIENDGAVDLDIQEAILLTNEYIYLKTSFITKEIIRSYIPVKSMEPLEDKNKDAKMTVIYSDRVIVTEPYIPEKVNVIPINRQRKEEIENNTLSKRKRTRGVINA